MFAVIFSAVTAQPDPFYYETVAIMRELAFSKYRCQNFIAVTEGEQEIAISYWLNEDDIARWHKDAQHVVAQRLGRESWYKSYRVDVTQIHRTYQFGNDTER